MNKGMTPEQVQRYLDYLDGTIARFQEEDEKTNRINHDLIKTEIAQIRADRFHFLEILNSVESGPTTGHEL